LQSIKDISDFWEREWRNSENYLNFWEKEKEGRKYENFLFSYLTLSFEYFRSVASIAPFNPMVRIQRIAIMVDSVGELFNNLKYPLPCLLSSLVVRRGRGGSWSSFVSFSLILPAIC
jgi:hypothetical protein